MYAINPDGSNVAGFPYDLGEKVQRGVALADFNGNGKADIVVGTDDEFIHLIYDDGTLGWSYETGHDIKVAPTVLELNTGEKIVLAGSKDDNFYGLNSDGTLRFMIETDDDISSEASIVDIAGVGPVIFFASGSMVYAVETDGDLYGTWDIGADISSSIVFSESNGTIYMMFGDEAAAAHMYDMQSNSYDNFPIAYSFPFKGSPTILDTDGDGDLEFVLGSTQSLINIDIKESGSNVGFWNTHRANMQRSGYYISTMDVLSIADTNIEQTFSILEAYPNPFNPSVTVDYVIQSADMVDIKIFDIKGNMVESIGSSFKAAGQHSVTWSPQNISSGVYFMNISIDNKVATQKLMFLK